MDVNNLEDRIDVLYFATSDFVERAPFAEISVEKSEPDQSGTFTIEFGGGELTTRQRTEANHTFSDMIGRLANLKDALKNSCTSSGLMKQTVEDCINNCPELCLIIDINNAEKHGYPLERKERSGRSPKIDNIRKELAVPLLPGRFSNLLTDGVVGLEADVVDGNHKFIMDVRDLIEGATSAWEDFCVRHFPSKSQAILEKREQLDKRSVWEAEMASKREEVDLLVADDRAWIPISASEIHHHMFLRAKDSATSQVLATGKMRKTVEENSESATIPIFDVTIGENFELSKSEKVWEVLTTQTEEQLGLIHNYYWDLFNPPAFAR
ncbi:hypothetical protein [uncultured Sulfitobacter sp.]|uniref:hypothetical protein n=1 Tax=uncultured Sulfitobacter sp. TaxID=191468 RepID=UPI00260281C8|nr:hypothetical protein [uncultured Sulfitobacter sp.]